MINFLFSVDYWQLAKRIGCVLWFGHEWRYIDDYGSRVRCAHCGHKDWSFVP